MVVLYDCYEAAISNGCLVTMCEVVLQKCVVERREKRRRKRFRQTWGFEAI